MKAFLFLALCALIAASYYVWVSPASSSAPSSAPSLAPLPEISRSPYEPFILLSSSGKEVSIVAIHRIDPEGLTFSPMPDAPLIGSNKLATLKTSWSNLDTQSLERYRELKRLHKQALQGKRLDLRIGSHFTDLDVAQQQLTKIWPLVTVYYADRSQGEYDFRYLINSARSSHRIKHWSMDAGYKADVLRHWSKIQESLQPVIYRKDVILFMNRLERAMRSIRTIPVYSHTFNETAARVIYELLTYTP